MSRDDETARDRPSTVEIEVPGTPEQVWQAIATGPGIGAWFVPAEVAEGEGGAIRLKLGQDVESTGTITGWEPPRRFAYVERWDAGESGGGVEFATEFLVEVRAGGTCVVRIVSSGFGEGPEWERARDDLETGWKVFLGNLRLYLAHFAGQASASFEAVGSAPGSRDGAWEAFLAALGGPAAAGERAVVAAGGLAFAGVVEDAGNRQLQVRIDDPAPGIVLAGVYGDGPVTTSVRAYLFGDEARAVAAREEPRWRTWMRERFPAVAAGGAAGA